MSGRFSPVVLFTALVAIIFATRMADDVTPTARGPASIVGMSDKPALTSASPVLFRHTEKLQGSLRSEIELVGPAPTRAGDTFEIKAWVSAGESLRDVDYQWALPDDVELVRSDSGDLHGRLTALPAKIGLVLRTRTGVNHQLHLTVGARRAGRRFAQSVQYNTLNEAALADARRNLLHSTKAIAGSLPVVSDR